VARVKRWVPWFEVIEFPAWPWNPINFNLSVLSEFAEGETLLRTHASLNMEVYSEDDATSAYPAPWRRIQTAVSLQWVTDGTTPLGFFHEPAVDYLFVAQVQWDVAYYTVNAPTTAQVRGTWSRNTATTGQIDSHSQRVAPSSEAALWLTIDAAPDDPGHPTQFTPYFSVLSRYLVDGV
jgi:hypothetical protein